MSLKYQVSNFRAALSNLNVIACWFCILFYLSLFFQGVVDVLCQACERLGWKNPTKIQKEAIPVALEGFVILIILPVSAVVNHFKLFRFPILFYKLISIDFCKHVT